MVKTRPRAPSSLVGRRLRQETPAGAEATGHFIDASGDTMKALGLSMAELREARRVRYALSTPRFARPAPDELDAERERALREELGTGGGGDSTNSAATASADRDGNNDDDDNDDGDAARPHARPRRTRSMSRDEGFDAAGLRDDPEGSISAGPRGHATPCTPSVAGASRSFSTHADTPGARRSSHARPFGLRAARDFFFFFFFFFFFPSWADFYS
jgi:hypothetical protein